MDGLVMNADTNGCDEGVEQRRMSTARTVTEAVAGRRLPSAILLLRIDPKSIVMLQTSRYSCAAFAVVVRLSRKVRHRMKCFIAALNATKIVIDNSIPTKKRPLRLCAVPACYCTFAPPCSSQHEAKVLHARCVSPGLHRVYYFFNYRHPPQAQAHRHLRRSLARRK